MKYEARTVEQHTATLANGVIVTRPSVAELIHTAKVQIENTKTTIACYEKQLQESRETLIFLERDLAELLVIEGVAK